MSEQLTTELMETNEELEILLEKLNELQKSIAGVDVAFNVDSLVKFTEKMMSATSTIHVFSGALSGNVTALTELQTKMPMAYNSLSTMLISVAKFKQVTEDKGFYEGMISGFDVVQKRMTTIQKGLSGITAGFSEFSIIKDVAHDVRTGIESLADNFAEISVSIVGAGVAFSSVFGFPAGIVVAGIMGVIGALAGVSTAMEEIETERFEESVKNALSNPGGVPIEKLTNNVVNSIASIGEQFSVITEKTQVLDTAEKNIQAVWLEIETVQTKMDAGVISVSEGTAELSRLFGELAVAAETKFGAMEQALVAMLGENSAIRQYAQTLGVDVTDALLVCLGVTDDMRDRAAELINLLANPNVSEVEKLGYYEELLNILGVTDDVTTAMSQFNAELANISTDNVDTAMESLATAVQNADKALDEAGKDITEILQKLKEDAKSVEEAEYIQFLIDLVPGAIASSKEQVRQEAALFTEQLQTELFGGIEELIISQENEWKSMNPMGRLFYSLVEGINTKDEYVQKCLEDYKASTIDPISETIDASLAGLKIQGMQSASETMESIIGALFDVTQYSDGNGTISYTQLNENWKEILYGITNGTYDLMKGMGADSVNGFVAGISENASSTAEVVSSWLDEDVTGVVQENLDIHSPSKVMEEFGLNAVLGFNNGIAGNTSLSVLEMYLYMDKVIKSFNHLYEKMYSVGGNALLWLYDGLTAQETMLYLKAQSIADNIASILNSAYTINSTISIPKLSYGDYGQYKVGYESMDISSSIEAKVDVAVSNAMIPYLEQLVQYSRETANKELSVSIGDKEIARANIRGKRQMGLQLITEF